MVGQYGRPPDGSDPAYQRLENPDQSFHSQPGSARVAPLESQLRGHVSQDAAVHAAIIASERDAEANFARIVDRLIQYLDPDIIAALFPLQPIAAANIAPANAVVWEVPLSGQHVLANVEIMPLNGTAYPSYVRVDIPGLGASIMLNSGKTQVQPLCTVKDTQRVSMWAADAANGAIVLVQFRRTLNIGARRVWEGET